MYVNNYNLKYYAFNNYLGEKGFIILFILLVDFYSISKFYNRQLERRNVVIFTLRIIAMAISNNNLEFLNII